MPIKNPEWVESRLSMLEFVKWDRFTVGEWGEEQALSVYGWIDRDDAHEDFVLLILWPEAEDVYSVTSSAMWTEEIHRRLFGDDPDSHNDCQRVEDTFDISNTVKLAEQTTLSEEVA